MIPCMIEFEGRHLVRSPRERVFRCLQSPSIIQKCIPACESLQPAGPGAYQARLLVGLGWFQTSLDAVVTIRSMTEPESCVLDFEAKGSGSTIRGTIGFRLEDRDGAGTDVLYESRTEVRGMLSMMKSRISENAREYASKFFADLERELNGGAACPGA
jgi:hypothetical protein